jgi:hypothetical protein
MKIVFIVQSNCHLEVDTEKRTESEDWAMRHTV